jgi:hypothetical protein
MYSSNPGRIAVSEARVAWAEEVKRLAESGVKEAGNDPRAELLRYRAAKLSAQDSMAYAEKQRKEAEDANAKPEVLAEYEKVVARERNKADVMEKLERTNDPAASAEEKERLKPEIEAGQRAHAEALFERELHNYERRITFARRDRQADGPAEVRQAEEELAKFRAEKEAYITRNIKKAFEARPFEDYE